MSSTKKRWWFLVGNLFNFRRLQVVIKANEATVRHFLFPGDRALNTATETYKQLSIDCFSNACDNLGRTISTKKTDVLHQPAAKKTRVVYQPALSKRKFPRLFDRLTYVFSTLSRSAKMDDDVNSRIAKASSVFGRLGDRVWGKRSSCLGKTQGLQACGAVFSTIFPVKHGQYTSATSKRLTNFTKTALEISWRSPWVTLRSSSGWNAKHTHSAPKSPA